MRTSRRLLAFMFLMPLWLLACGDGAGDSVADRAKDNAGKAADEAREATEDVQGAAQDAWATLETEAEGLVDRIQTGSDPLAKQQLLEKCRSRLESLRKAESDLAGKAEAICDRIRDTDVSDRRAWDEIKADINAFPFAA